MTAISIGILGLDRLGTSFALALKRSMKNGGANTFTIKGYDPKSANEKEAQKLGAVEKTERTPEATVRNQQIVVMNLPYEDVRDAYRRISPDLQDGVVIIDLSPLKMPSYQWGKQYLTDEHHLVGVTPIINPRFIFETQQGAIDASEDYFDGGIFFINPSVDIVQDAIDLVYNIAQLVGSKPRFLDPQDHDKLFAQTDQLPALLGIALFYNVQRSEGWDDMQWLTNANFGVLTRFLKDKHPDALRDELMHNRESLTGALDQLIATLKELRNLLHTNNRDAIEGTLMAASESYEDWLNRRNRNDWDKTTQIPSASPGIMGMLLGDKLSNRLKGKKN